MRTIVQFAVNNVPTHLGFKIGPELYALCNDGTFWTCVETKDASLLEWVLLKDVPQGPREHYETKHEGEE